MSDTHPSHLETSKQVYANAWFSIREDTVQESSGDLRTYAVFDSSDMALIIPITDGRVHLVDQYRHPVGARRWEFPSGNVEEKDPDPSDTARRELQEETGWVAETLTPIGALEVLPSTSVQRCWVFLATDLTQGSRALDPDEGGLRSEWFTRAEFERMVMDGQVTDSRTIAAYGQLLMHEKWTGATPTVTRR